MEKIVSRFRGKLVKMIKNAGSKYDYLILPKIRQIFIKINYYWFNRQEILQKAKEKYSKEKADEYYKQNKEDIKDKSKERYKRLSQEKNDKIKEYQRKKRTSQ